jgi:hypothetical protein
MELVMSVYGVSEVEAWKILKSKAERRRERAERRRMEREAQASHEFEELE